MIGARWSLVAACVMTLSVACRGQPVRGRTPEPLRSADAGDEGAFEAASLRCREQVSPSSDVGLRGFVSIPAGSFVREIDTSEVVLEVESIEEVLRERAWSGEQAFSILVVGGYDLVAVLIAREQEGGLCVLGTWAEAFGGLGTRAGDILWIADDERAALVVEVIGTARPLPPSMAEDSTAEDVVQWHVLEVRSNGVRLLHDEFGKLLDASGISGRWDGPRLQLDGTHESGRPATWIVDTSLRSPVFRLELR